MTAAAALSEQEPPRAGSCEQRNVSREPGEVSRETREGEPSLRVRRQEL